MSALDRFERVSLDELVTEAALLTRIDRKYVLPRAAAENLLAGMDPQTRVLEIDGARRFSYESVYFDTPELLSFHMAAQPRRRRFKLRTRSYLDTGSAFLEIKTRGARGATVKERGAYDPADAAGLTATARAEVATALEAIGVAGERADHLEATLVTRYRRATLLAPDGVGRATVDTDLEWAAPDGIGFALPELAIVETKSGAAASVVDRALWRAGVRPATVSKYATGLAALHPRLPRNRWARLLRGPFAPDRRAPLDTGAPTSTHAHITDTRTTHPEMEDASCSAAA
jgi:hypothetical protein